MKDTDKKIVLDSRTNNVLFIVIVLLSFLIGTLLTYEVDGFKITSVIARSLALLLIPASSSIIIYVISLLVKKKMKRQMLINLSIILWLFGASTDLITYYLL